MRLAVASLLVATSLLLAPDSAAASGCPEEFHLHAVDDVSHEHGEHRYVGVSVDDVDRNGNGLICVKHVGSTGDIHLHIDDSTPS